MLRFHPQLLLSRGSGASNAPAGDSEDDEAQEMERADEQEGFGAARPVPVSPPPDYKLVLASLECTGVW